MSDVNRRLLKVFLCHASGDKPPVRELYNRLTLEGVDAWLDKERLLPGQDWRLEIPRAVRDADVVVVCLSKKSITKEGYVQREIKFALDIAEEKPEGTIFLIPARLEECAVPDRLNRWQWVDLYENDGFIKLLRSLKLRAGAVGATVEPVSYIDSQKESDLRLEQLYTEGLAAFYTEDWDRACQRFQSILSERPNHRQAAEKLREAERQRELARLYERATDAVQNVDWGAAIQILETLSQKSTDYKDSGQMLRNARRQKQLGELYTEAKALHTARQWEAVVKVFEQISVLDSTYPDQDDLLSSAQIEVAELRRVAELNEQYGNALREMDSGNWYEARRLLETVHKSQTGFKETEKLLKKVESEIAREDEKRRQNDQINTLYEQAHGLLRSKKWRNALDKMDEIRKLDDRFPDTDGIIEKAQKELTREEAEAERQNTLAALYAEAVKLLKDEKYQEASDKWKEVRAIDPRYPDRQWVGRTAKKALAKQVKPITTKSKFVMPKSLWIGLGGIGAITILIFAINQFGKGEYKTSLAPTKTLTDVVVENNAPSTTNVPQKTSTPRPVTPTLTKLLMEEHIVYSGTDGSGDQIFLMDPDGGNVKQLTFEPGQVRRRPSISPDGDKIVFTSGQWGDMNLYLINPDSSDLTNLTELKGDENEPKWSPDGNTIIFTSTRDGNSEIYLINVDKTGFTRLTNDPADDWSPYWHPDGKTIVFCSGRDGNYNIFTMKPDGSELNRITTNNSNDTQPSWSPNGDYIAFISDRNGNNDIYIMKSDGSDQTNITNHPSDDRYPNWSPDGTYIVFFSDRVGDGSIWIYSIELSSNLIVKLASGGSPFWGFIKP